VLDTNVLVAAFRSKRGASHELVRLIGTGELRPNVSVALALEYEELLKRDGVLQGGCFERGQVCQTRMTSISWKWRSNAHDDYYSQHEGFRRRGEVRRNGVYAGRIP
jgi:hypothetical protein